ncbi:MAG: Bug family tripartite tricarboxylate transporter substrate binding protein, partial [Burkholderiales bacterium]
MSHRRRSYCRVLVALGALGVFTSSAAQSYPTRPIRLVVAQSAGGNADFVGRAYSQRLAERFGQQIVVDNRPGGAGIIGTEIVARALPDGYTLLLAPTGHSINPGLYSKLPFDPQRDFAPVSLLAISYAVVVVSPQSSVRSVPDLVALAKAKPGQLHFASSGTAAATHLAGELFNAMAGVNIVHVAYKGAPPALVDLMGGRVDVMFASPPSAMPLVRSGRLRAIATTGTKRAAYLPELPSFLLIAGIQFLCTGLASLRLSFVPVAIVTSIVVPMLSPRALSWLGLLVRKGRKAGAPLSLSAVPIVVILVISVGLSQLCLFGYRS